MEFSVAARITGEELIDEMYYQETDEVIRWILNMDLRWGDTDFTIRLIEGLVESLKREGLDVKFRIKETR